MSDKITRTPLVEPLTLLHGDCRQVLKTLPEDSVNCCVTSPPYWGLRDYGVDGQCGLEATPEGYVSSMVEIFREVKRVLRGDATLWLNLGDSYAAGKQGNYAFGDASSGLKNGGPSTKTGAKMIIKQRKPPEGLKPKDLVGIPWAVAFALRSDGWYLRSDIIWHKPNPMPESVTDRPTKAHEYIFLLSKSERYYYDAEAIALPASDSYANDSRWESGPTEENEKNGYALAGAQNPKAVHRVFNGDRRATVNRRTVWTVPTAPYAQNHFATFPPNLIKPCILAGCPIGGLVLDPFAGSGTTGAVALELGRRTVLIELNPDYIKLCDERCAITQGLPL